MQGRDALRLRLQPRCVRPGSRKNITAEAEATVWGIGAAAHKSVNAAAKKRGRPESCRGESAHEVDTCKAPIRLTLREIEEGTNPRSTAAVLPDTPAALSLAGQGRRENQAQRQGASACRRRAHEEPRA